PVFRRAVAPSGPGRDGSTEPDVIGAAHRPPRPPPQPGQGGSGAAPRGAPRRCTAGGHGAGQAGTGALSSSRGPAAPGSASTSVPSGFSFSSRVSRKPAATSGSAYRKT